MAENGDMFGKLDEVDKSRLCGLSDGITAFAMTLLVLQIAIPDPQTTANSALPQAVVSLWPKFLVFMFSFIVIGYYWTIHHRIIRHVSRFDPFTFWLNIAFLICVVLMPFSSALMGEYEDQPISATVFAANLGLAGIFLSMIGYHAHRRGALLGGAAAKGERYYMLRGIVPAVVFIVSIPIAHISVNYAALLWLCIPLFLCVAEKATGKKE